MQIGHISSNFSSLRLGFLILLDQKLILMYLYVLEKIAWLVINDNKHAGVQHGNALFLLDESAFVLEDCLVVPSKEGVLLRQLVVIG